MYLPRSLISTLYLHLQRTHHPLSPPVLILVSLEPDALCGCRILTNLLKRDYISHKIQPVAGYGSLETAGHGLVKPMMTSQGGAGGVVVCLGVGGLVDLGSLLGIGDDGDDDGSYGGVEVWVVDARRPWNLSNVFGGVPTTLEVNAETGERAWTRKDQGVIGGKIDRNYKAGKGGIVVLDDGDIEMELNREGESYLALAGMPEVNNDNDESDDSSTDADDDDDDEKDLMELQNARSDRKRKSWQDHDSDEDTDDNDRPRQRRKSNSSSPIPESPTRPDRRGLLSLAEHTAVGSPGRTVTPTPAQPPRAPSARRLRRRLLRLRRKHERVLRNYYALGTSYSEPISSMMYSLASELGREDNDHLWLNIVGVTSMEIYGRSSAGVSITAPKRASSAQTSFNTSGWLGIRGTRIRQLLRDEVRRLNPPELTDSGFLSSSSNRIINPEISGIIPTTARSPNDTSIRLSPEPRFLLIRHWSLYDSMLHSPYLSSRLRIWSDVGIKRLHKLLAKMGISLAQSRQNYTNMDMEVKRELRQKLLRYADVYGLEGLIPGTDSDGRGGDKEGWSFVRSWGWRATLSAQDVGVVIGAILEVGKKGASNSHHDGETASREIKETFDEDGELEGEEWVGRFWDAYDSLEKVEKLKMALPTAQYLHRAILRTGTSLVSKRQIKHLRAFRMCVVKEGPDVALFSHPSALIKLALWIGEAIAEQERESRGKLGHGGRGTPLVVAGLNEGRGVYMIVGIGGGGIESSSCGEAKDVNEAGSDDDDINAKGVKGYGLNRFGNAFQEVVDETSARVRIDSFEHCVAEIKMGDLAAFLEALSVKAVVG